MLKTLVVWGFAPVLVGTLWLFAAEPPSESAMRDAARKQFQAGNFADAFTALQKLISNGDSDPVKTAEDIGLAVQSLQRLGRLDEVDGLLSTAVAAHEQQWRVLHAAAQQLANVEHYGHIIAGEFSRGQRRGGGEFVSCADRDRVLGLRWLVQALPLMNAEPNKEDAARFYLDLSQFVQGSQFGRAAWKLQLLTNVADLPDYDPTQMYFRRGWGGGETRGAPVDEQGNPLLYHVPESWDAAKNDGERWRWLLMMAAETDAKLRGRVGIDWARFLDSQFGVQTIAGSLGEASGDDDRATGPFALHTLSDDETIARLATGVKRFKLPDEFHYLAQFRSVVALEDSAWSGTAANSIASAHENRRQYVKAAAEWKAALDKFGSDGIRKERLEQITGNWGTFEGTSVQPAGEGAKLGFRYRNAKQAKFTAQAIRVAQLLEDVKAYLKQNPAQLQYQQINIGDLGYRLVNENQAKYVGEQVAQWTLDLEPRPEHLTRLIDVATPLQKAGAYLVTAQLADGNTSRIVVWVADTAIVKKQLDQKSWYFVADAVSGKPVEKANVEFFGWTQTFNQNNRRQTQVQTKNFAEFSDANGQIMLDQQRLPQNHQWLITARTTAGRFAYLGFTGVWYSRYSQEQYDQRKTYVITDRPVYRPSQTVKFKFWLQQAKYDQPDQSPFANRKYTVLINNPQGEKVFEQQYTTDKFGGLEGEWPLADEAMLGSYYVVIENFGGGSFRVEEYKKPEFEVTVDAPSEPVQLGDKITATIRAKYYFGAPVVNAKVKYKIERTPHTARWYPAGPWDWFYGKGYRWQGYDYTWYPGFARWGCVRPVPSWWGRPTPQPELVSEQEVDIGPDGTVEVVIDTLPAKELHGDQDHSYQITAEVVDESRRTIVGNGNVLVARQPFQVTTWVDRGYYQVGDTIVAHAAVYTLDQKPVAGKGKLTLYRIQYNDKGEPQETAVETVELNPDSAGQVTHQFAASAAGQYRLSYSLTDAKDRTIEGGYVFLIRGPGFDGREFRFNDVEILTDKTEYAPGDTLKLLVNTRKADSTVALFLRPVNGVYQPPQILRLQGKSTTVDVGIVPGDMPNFFIEACTIADGKYHMELRDVVVPPEKRVLNIDVVPSKTEYQPGAPATVEVKLTDHDGKPFVGSTVLSVYDRSVEYISGGSNVPEIREFFWKWQRHHHPQRETNLDWTTYNLLKPGEVGMLQIGIFGGIDVVTDAAETMNFFGGDRRNSAALQSHTMMNRSRGLADAMPMSAAGAPPAPGMAGELRKSMEAGAIMEKQQDKGGGGAEAFAEAAVRSEFADTAYWNAAVTTDADGFAKVEFKMPENLTAWKIKAWGMGLGAKVGESTVDVVTKKNLLVRLQAPRFFVETDEVVLSANVHNYLASAKKVRVVLELDGGCLEPLESTETSVEVAANGEQRVDWRVKVTKEGTAVIRMKALSDEESDAMQMSFPVYVHGMSKTESFSNALRPNEPSGQVVFTIPEQRRINDSRIEARFSPTLAGAMVDALPYLVEYPYGCTEQTLNRFLPTVITQRILQKMQLDLKAIQEKRTNLNAQQLGDPAVRAAQWKRFDRNPVFDESEVTKMVKDGVERLTSMQLSDGGWGWFSGYGERSYPHTTAVVVHGLQVATQNDVALVPGTLEKGIAWLKRHQEQEVQKLKNAPDKKDPWKSKADAIDAFVYMILVDADIANSDMQAFLFRDRIDLPVYAKALFGLALHKQQQADQLQTILENISQFVVEDNENQTAYLRLPENNWWWSWYGSEIEANAYYLKLLTAVNPQDARASKLVKYLLNNRRHATYWNSTRDTALCVEALAGYLTASGEDKPDLTVEIWLDGVKQRDVKIDASNLFLFDNSFTLLGDAVTTGEHTLEFRKTGQGPLYFNTYVTNFTLEDFITHAGLEVKVNRKFYKLTRVDKTDDVAGSRGQAVQQQVEKFERTELPNLSQVTSGDLVEIELEIDSKNDYEYLVFEDMKAAGFEPVELRSGYTGNALNAYVEYRDERAAFFVRMLPRGKHSMSYRLRAEIPGSFSALPTRASAMYAPELKGNSDEMKVKVVDRE